MMSALKETTTKDLKKEIGQRAVKQKRPGTLFRSGRSFLQERVYTTLYFFVKGNIQLFLFFLELVSFQEHSCRIPWPIFPCAALASPGSDAIQKEDLCRII